MTDKLRQAAQMALDALEHAANWLDPQSAAYVDCTNAIESIRTALAAPHYPLPDSLYPGSKDWMAGDYADRVEWLHMMYESKRQELEALLAAPQGEPVAFRVLPFIFESKSHV